MQIIIVGCGKVGLTLAEQLTGEGHNLVLIDPDSSKIQEAVENFDVMGIVGNGSSFNVLSEADVDHTDLLIAVTGSDELNLLCCLIARKTGHCQTIARVRNPLYSKEIAFIKEQLGISMIINPELAAATEISRILRFPSANRIDRFAKGKVELVKFRIRPEFKLDGYKVADIFSRLRFDVLVCAVERGEEVAIPNGDFVLRANDVISIMATPQDSMGLFSRIGVKTNQVKNCMIVGGGTIGYYLAKQLMEMNIKVHLIEANKERCDQLTELLPEATIIHGDATDKQLLTEEGLEQAESFVCLTNLDEENLFLALYAKKHSNAKLIAKVNRITFDDIIDELEIDSIIYPKYITADHITRYVRAMQNSIGSNVETLYRILDNRAEALEFIVREESEVTNIPLSDLNTRDNLLISCIMRNGTIRIPRGHDSIQVGDTVVVVTTAKALNDIRDIVKK
ncbi:MAG: Trk system potassium transporter TrkA [Lachnospiraceae bacterium]|nr:Trk system potassium transporter TrkA [Lachnospiraceae bacterium]